ncbi:hypothetical protein AB7M43_002882 [Bradyrhizobium elkanii]
MIGMQRRKKSTNELTCGAPFPLNVTRQIDPADEALDAVAILDSDAAALVFAIFITRSLTRASTRDSARR